MASCSVVEIRRHLLGFAGRFGLRRNGNIKLERQRITERGMSMCRERRSYLSASSTGTHMRFNGGCLICLDSQHVAESVDSQTRRPRRYKGSGSKLRLKPGTNREPRFLDARNSKNVGGGGCKA